MYLPVFNIINFSENGNMVRKLSLHDFTKTDTGLPTRPEAARDRSKRLVINPSPPIVVWMVQTDSPGLVTGLQAL